VRRKLSRKRNVPKPKKIKPKRHMKRLLLLLRPLANQFLRLQHQLQEVVLPPDP
jgi:hypothetical protein